MKKTDELDFELKNNTNIDTFLQSNKTEFDDNNFCKLLNQYINESDKSKFNIAIDSDISPSYIYNIIKGEKRPTRDTVIKLSLELNLCLESSERLLKLSGYSKLYVRHKRDSILKFAIENNLSVSETEDILLKYGFSIK